MSTEPAIGIDLGTTFSSVGFWVRGRMEIIANDQGNRITPSCVAFNETERLIGEAAKNQVMSNPMNTIFDAKRLIGRSFDDKEVQQDMEHWPFTVINDKGKPMIEVQFKGKTKMLSPEEIGSMVLSKMKETAEAYLERQVRNAVIAVPAYFSDAQRQATKDAGTIAGLNVIGIINEPTAGALAYGLDKDFRGTRNVLIYDLGGGTFDVSIVTINEGSHFDVKATGGNNHLGGEDFDSRLVNHLAAEFERKHGKNLTKNKKSLSKLRVAAERAKRLLSSSVTASLDVDAIYEKIDFKTKISRAKFEDLCMDLFRNTLEHVEKALSDARMEKNRIDEIVLIGGSTRIPKIQNMLKDFFNGKSLNHSINPDEAVAYGAAIRAASLSENPDSAQIENIILEDVSTLSLGIETKGGIMNKIIERNSRIPCNNSKRFTTSFDNQTKVTIDIFEGERELTEDNNLLGSFELTGIPPAPSGSVKIDVTFEIDTNGILNVSAIDKATGISNKTIIKNKARFSEAEIKRLVTEAEKYKEEDIRNKERIQAMNQLESYTLSLQQDVVTNEKLWSKSKQEQINAECEAIIQYLESDILKDKKDCDTKLKKLKLLEKSK